MKIFERDKCRISEGKSSRCFELGKIAPLSCFPKENDPLPAYLPIVLCLNPESGLVQLRHTVNPDDLYSQYWYMSGVNESMKKALKSIVVKGLEKKERLKEKSIVVDIASNDGTLLGFYPPSLFRVGDRSGKKY